MKVKQADSATQLLKRLGEFLAQLETLIGLFPAYLEHDPKQTSWNDVLGFIPRYWQRAKQGTVAVERDKVQYDELKSIFTRLLEAGKKIQSALPHDEDDFEKKVQKMLALKENAELVAIMIDYFSASATLGLIHHSIKPLMESLGYCVRIRPSTEFIKAFETLIGLANARSSKVNLMLNEMDKQSRRMTEQEDAAMKSVCQRFDTLARLSELMATFAVFSTQKPVKTKSQLDRETQAHQMALAAGGKTEESHEIIALRDFIQLFGFDDLTSLLPQIRDWELGKLESLQTLQRSLKIFIEFVDQRARTKTEIKLSNELYDALGKQCHLFMTGKIDEAGLQEALENLRKQVDPNLLAALENTDFDIQDDDATAPLDHVFVPPPIARTPTMNGLFQALAADLSLDANALDANFILEASQVHNLGLENPSVADDTDQHPTGSTEPEYNQTQLRSTLLDLFGEDGVYDLGDYDEVENLPEDLTVPYDSLPFLSSLHADPLLDPESILQLTTVLNSLFNETDNYTSEDFDSAPADDETDTTMDPLLFQDSDLTPAAEMRATTTKPTQGKDWLDTLAEQADDFSDEDRSSDCTLPFPPITFDLSDEEISSGGPPPPPFIIPDLEGATADLDLDPTQAPRYFQTTSLFELGEEATSTASMSTENAIEKAGKKNNTVLLKALFFEKAAKAVKIDGRNVTVPFDEKVGTPSPLRPITSKPAVEVKHSDSTADGVATTLIESKPPLNDWLDALAEKSESESCNEETSSNDSSSMSL